MPFFVGAALTRSKSGAYTARKASPRTLRTVRAALWPPLEAKFIPSCHPQVVEAKAQHAEWLAEVRGIDAIRPAKEAKEYHRARIS
jgi:hypothetical protein